MLSAPQRVEDALTPQPAVITAVVTEARDVKSFRYRPVRPPGPGHVAPRPGQFLMVSLFGLGEVPLSYAAPEDEHGQGQFTLKVQGRVTSALYRLSQGDSIGIRGPFGNAFPVDTAMRQKDLAIISGGIGAASVRALWQHVLANRADYGRLTLIHGSETAADMPYLHEYGVLREAADTQVHLTVYRDSDGWDGPVGYTDRLLAAAAPSPAGAVAVYCGGPSLSRTVRRTLGELGFDPAQVYTTLEMKMQCGVGRCARCNIGPSLVCREGPVYRLADLLQLPDEY